ncbi:hypothetical protein QNH20_18315 [Neobacillus sp. WH10]|uniref:hypothetical protein n=1 Tax=Neobacillus sp. WH10 TaxID=3047873 RepID=UPI0024C20C43|nr:hypothetical protein [Neobacillus sp. WH10]WHY76067.1 hypothetical protein QNH20_18315 [Neobacillus sp. WH10]
MIFRPPKVKATKGLERDLLQFEEAELGFTKDTKRFFVGSDQGNVELAKQEEVSEGITDLQSQITQVDSKSNDAVNKANDVQNQFDRVVAEAGSNNPEVVQARGNEVNLNARLNKVDTQLTESDNRLKESGFNIRWNALLALSGDWTTAIQTALDNYTHVYIPEGTFPFTSLTVTRFGTTISGDGQLNGSSKLQYSGSAIAIKVMGSVNYLKLQNIQLLGIPAVSTDYFNIGSIGIDITDGNVSIMTDGLFISGFERCILSNYNGYYSKITNSRFEKSKECLVNFSANNLDIKDTRFQKFHNAIIVNGTNLTISKCSFEIFNGSIVNGSGAEAGIITMKDCYVEIYDNIDLPTNFPNQIANGALAGKFGGNILFTGAFSIIKLIDNDLQLGGVFRVVSVTDCKSLESKNLIHIYSSGNNLDRLYNPSNNLKSFNVNDTLGKDLGVGPYNRTYNQPAFTLNNPFGDNLHFDPILGRNLISFSKVHTPTLLNNWNTTDNTQGVPRVFLSLDGLTLSGHVNGTNKTGDVLFVLTDNYRPFAYTSNRTYVNLTGFTDFGSGSPVRFQYNYTNGEFKLIGAPSSLANISLDGLFIPLRI